jgi:hypothetical protein
MNVKTLAIEYGAPQPATISPGQRATFDILTGGGLGAYDIRDQSYAVETQEQKRVSRKC